MRITTQLAPSADGDTLCIDSTFFPPGGTWLWSSLSGTFTPNWGGPYCYSFNWPWASIAGTKFHDENGNAVWDAGESTIDNINIRLHGNLDAGGTVDLSTLTDMSGSYMFAGLTPGDYWVMEDFDPTRGWQTFPPTVFHTVSDLMWGQNRADLNFGNDTLCDDLRYETTESCLDGGDDQFVGPEPSNLSSGFLDYLTVNSPGFIAEFDRPADDQWFGHTFEGCWDAGCEVVGATMRIKLHAASSGQTNTDNMSLGDYSQGSTVSGRIWSINLRDLDLFMGGDGVWSNSEVTTFVLDLANLPPNNWLPTNLLGAIQDGTFDVMVTDETGVDFIEIEVELCCPDGTICGYKFNDLNANGVWDQPGEPGLPGWTIEAERFGGVTYSQVTDVNGEYCFNQLPLGHYEVREIGQLDWYQTYPHAGPQRLNLFNGPLHVWTHTDVDFGNYYCETDTSSDLCTVGNWDNFTSPSEPSSPDAALLAQIQNCSGSPRPYFDSPEIDACFGHSFDDCFTSDCPIIGARLCVKLRANNSGGSTNDFLQLGEWTTGGGSMWYISMNDLLSTFTNGSDESWDFGDEVMVCLNLLDLPFQGVGPRSLLPLLSTGQLNAWIHDDTDVDAFELVLEYCCSGSICGIKFNDLNGNGIQDAGEPGIPGWTITLDDGYMFYPTVTDANGEYCYTGLEAGHYSVWEHKQPGWTQTFPQFATYEIDLPTVPDGDWNFPTADFGNFFCDVEEHDIILDSCLAGIKDDFALPTEPANPSPGLLAQLQACGVPDPFFDSDLTDVCFGHSFDECWTEDCPVISAQLHFKVEALSGGASTDVIALGDWSAGPGSSTWWCYIGDLGPGPVLDYTFDLANMPTVGHGPTNLLPYLQDGRIDVLIQDDTKVDFLELIYELCCPDCCELRGDMNHDGVIDIADLVYLVDFMFSGGPAPVPCDRPAPPAKVSCERQRLSFDIEYTDGVSTVVMNSPIDLRGIQLELNGVGSAPVNLVGNHVDMVHGREGRLVKIGLLDLDGSQVVESDVTQIIRLEGKYTLESVTVADVNARSITPAIGRSAKLSQLPADYALNQNYPNPFNPSTSISFALPEAAEVRLEVYNLLGQRVITLINQRLEAGNHVSEWDSCDESGQSVSSGVYFYRMETLNYTETRKMVLLK